jgi:hypothetical protein
MTIEMYTGYPWYDETSINIGLTDTKTSTLYLRIPDWADKGLVSELHDIDTIYEAPPGSYYPILVRDGSCIVLTMPMVTRRITSNPNVTGNLGRVALQCGPLIYCIEQADHDVDVWSIALPDDAKLKEEWRPDFLGGVMVITGEAVSIPPATPALYSRYCPEEEVEATPVAFTAIPYYAWANREAGPMQVWIPTLPAIETEVGYD